MVSFEFFICELDPQIVLLLLSTCFALVFVVSGVPKGNQGLQLRRQLPTDIDWHFHDLAPTPDQAWSSMKISRHGRVFYRHSENAHKSGKNHQT